MAVAPSAADVSDPAGTPEGPSGADDGDRPREVAAASPGDDLDGFMDAARAKEDAAMEGFLTGGAQGSGIVGSRPGASLGRLMPDVAGSAASLGDGAGASGKGEAEGGAGKPAGDGSGVNLAGEEDPVFRAMLNKVAGPAEGAPDDADAAVEFSNVGSGGVVADLERQKKEADDLLEAQRRKRVEQMKLDEEEARRRAEAEAAEEERRRKAMEPCIPKKYWYAMEWWQHVEWESDLGEGWAPLCPGCSPRNSHFDRITCGLTSGFALVCFGAVATGAVFLHDEDHRCKYSSSLALLGLVWGVMCSVTPLLIGCYMCMDRYQYHRYTLRAQRIIEKDEEERQKLLNKEGASSGDEEEGKAADAGGLPKSASRSSMGGSRGRGSKADLHASASRTSMGSRSGGGGGGGGAAGWGGASSSDAKVADSLMSKSQRKKVEAAKKAEEQEQQRREELARKRRMLPVIPEWYVECKYAVRAASGWATLCYGLALVPWIGVIIGLYKADGNLRPELNGDREACAVLTDDGLCLGERECDHALYGYDLFWVIVYPLAIVVFLWLYFKRTELMKRLKKPGGW